MRWIGPLIALTMTLAGWTVIVATTYHYFPQTMNVTSPITLAFAVITVGVIFPSIRRMWQTSKQLSYEKELDKNIKSRPPGNDPEPEQKRW